MSEEHPSGGGLMKSKTGLALLVFGAIAAFFLITEHRAHLWGWLPYLLLLACPLMHVLMHGGHGGHGGHSDEQSGASDKEPEAKTPGRETHQHHDTTRDKS